MTTPTNPVQDMTPPGTAGAQHEPSPPALIMAGDPDAGLCEDGVCALPTATPQARA